MYISGTCVIGYPPKGSGIIIQQSDTADLFIEIHIRSVNVTCNSSFMVNI